MMPAVENLIAILEQQASERYGEEGTVSQLEHALQCAVLAERESGDPALITAALLHDVGHMLHQLGDDAAMRGIDARHEEIGHKYLRRHFSERVAAAVRMHVAAKRYLCTIEADYFCGLSSGSVRSLSVQGGPFLPKEADTFIDQPYAKDAVKIRRWDDRAKVRGKETPPLAHFVPYVFECSSAT